MADQPVRQRSRRGRPRGFDRDRALDVAMRLFWRHGYEGVSLSELTAALGIAPPSLYAAFGSKAELYLAALDRYEAISPFIDGTDVAEAGTLEQAIRSVLTAGVDAVTRRDRERGCMVSDGLVSCSEANDGLAAHLARRRQAIRRNLTKIFERWLDKDQARSLARYVAALLQGISIQARDGASAADLRPLVDIACAHGGRQSERARA